MFQSRNSLYKHKCDHKESPRALAHSSQIIECEYRSPQYQTANRSKKAVYAAFLTGFSDHQRLALVVADSGCDCTLISESFVEKFVSNAHRIPIPPTPVNGISSGVVTSGKVVFDLLVPARLNQEPVTCKIRIEAHIIPKMPAGLLIGTDNMTPERMNVDLDLQRIQFKGHKGAYTPLQPVKHDSPGPPHAIKATQPRMLLPGKDCFVPYWRKGVKPGFLRPGKDYLFEPNHPQLSFYAALLSNQTQVVIARNCSPHVYHLENGEVLGTVVELPPMHAMVAGQGDPTIALQEGKKGVEASPLTPESDQQKHKLASGVTLAGSSDEIAYLEAVVEEFAQLWVNDGTPVDIPMRYWMTVPTKKGAEFPKRVRAYPMSPDEREITNKTLDKLHDEGKLIWSTGHTPSAFPVFVTYREVEKDGKIVRKPRVVVDIRKLNEITEPDVYPVQQQDDLLLRIAGKKHLSVFDAASFFYQWLVHPAHRHKMSVISHRGQETFNVAIMGYINSIAYVARQMANILRGCEAYCVVYVDDIIVFSDSYQDHLSHLRLIFNRLLGYNITLSPEKTFLGFNSVIILGQKVNSLGMMTTEERIRSLMAWQFPRNYKELERYVGGVGFLRKYIPRFSQIVQPLEDYKTLLLKGSPSSGGAKRKHYSIRRELTEAGSKELEAFRELQSIISKGLFLHHQDTKKPLLINVDASKEYGFGAMVYQAREDWAGYATSDFSSPPPRTKTCPIMFLSRSLQGGEARFHPTDMELACIVWVLRKIKVYVELSPRTIFYTDHASNTYIAHQSVQQASMGGYNMRLTLGAVLIRSFKNVEVKYIRGEDNTMADALSRNPGIKGYDGIPSTTDPTGCTLDPLPQHAMVTTRAKRSRQVSSLPETNEKYLMASLDNNNINPNDSADPPLPPSQDRQQLTMALPDDIRENRKQSYTEILVSEEIKTRALEGYKHDPKWTRIISQLDSKAKDAERTGRMIPEYPFYLDESRLLWQRFPHLRLCLPTSMEQEIFALCHTPMHLGYRKALQRMSPFCLVRGAARLRAYIQSCPQCLQTRTRRHPPHGELQPIMEPLIPFHTISIDIVLGLPDGIFNSFMSVTDKATKRCMFIPGRSNWDAQDWGHALDVRLAEGDWGTPRKIISDRDPKFTAQIWKTMWTNRHVKLAYTTAYHAQADGQSEMTNQVAEIAIRNWLPRLPTPYHWHLALPYLQTVLNSSIHTATKTSPHRLMYGLEVPSDIGPLADRTQQILFHEGERYDASIAVAEAMMTMSHHYDSCHLPVHLKPGSKVMLRLHKGYNIPSTRAFPKVSIQYAGPFRVKRQVTPLAFELELPSRMKIHPVVSVAHLDPLKGDYDPFDREPIPPQPVRMEDGRDDSWEIESLIDRRDVKQGRKTIREYLVRWKGFGPEEDLWYSAEDLQNAQELMKEYDDALVHSSTEVQAAAALPRQASLAEQTHNDLEVSLSAFFTSHEPRTYEYQKS